MKRGQLAHLLRHSVDDLRPPVADVHVPEGGCGIQVAPARLVVDVDPFTAIDDEGACCTLLISANGCQKADMGDEGSGGKPWVLCPAMPADLVFVNGPVFTAGPARSFARALAVTGERITAVGDETTVSESIGPATRVVDLAGRMLSPGFQDAHCHPGSSGLDLLRCSFEGCASAEDAIEYVARYADDHPETEWILGGGWHQTWFPRGCPPKEALDTVVPDRPVLVYNADGHGAWANSLALSLAGVDASTPDPSDGRIERNEDNQPQGTLHEGAAWLVERMAPQATDEDVRAGLLAGQAYLLTKGITAWQDAHVDEETHRAYRALAASDELIGTAVGALWWSQRRGMEQIEDLERMRSSPWAVTCPQR